MKNKLIVSIVGIVVVVGLFFLGKEVFEMGSESYHFESEDKAHEGTWITWPHRYTYGKKYCEKIEYIWLEIAKALSPDEMVHIIAYDDKSREEIEKKLENIGVNMANIDFLIAKSDDVWTRDTGPLFARDGDGDLKIIDFAFDGWGKKTPYLKDDKIPVNAGKKLKIDVVSVNDFVLEGGSFEMSDDNTLMATKSSVISKNRNPDMTQSDAESYMKKYLGAENFIWLDGVTDEDITDAHIDGFARFYDEKTIITVSKNNFLDLYEGIKESDYKKLTNARNVSGEKYKILEVPMTEKNVKGLDYKGSYLNYYIGNKSLLVPVYGDKNDDVAIGILEKLYNKKVIPINVVPLYKNGGMIHCITSHQPYSRLEEIGNE